MPTSTQLAQMSVVPYVQRMYDQILPSAPLWEAIPARGFIGTRYKSIGRYSIQQARFINRNEGYLSGEVTFAVQDVEAFRIGASIKAPLSSTREYNQSNQFGLDFMSVNIRGQMEADLLHLDRQLFYGTLNDAKGFMGLKELTPATTANTLAATDVPADIAYKKTAINAGGTTAATATSIYLLRLGTDGVELLLGGPTGVAGFLNYSQPRVVDVINETDPVDGLKKDNQYLLSVGEGYVGLSVAGSSQMAADRLINQHAVRRAYNVTLDSGKGVTDELLDRMVQSLPINARRNLVFVMSSRSQSELRKARGGFTSQIVLNSGNGQLSSVTPLAPLPTDHNGIRIIVDDMIGNQDAIEVPS